MTETTTQDQPQQPRHATMADLEALEGRIINRIADLETRIARDINTAFWRQLLVLLALIVALSVPIINLGVNIMSTQATILSKLPPT